MDDPRLSENLAVLLWFQEWEEEVAGKTNMTKKERNRMFLTSQLYFDLKSMILGFHNYCEVIFSLFPGAQIKPAYTNQDKSENLFGCVRGANGPNEMPNEAQYGKYLKVVPMRPSHGFAILR